MSSTYNYTDSPNANLLCCICRSPFVDPCTTRTCCHTFCYECIAQAIAISHQCPIDRTTLSLHDLIPADPVIRNLVDELIVSCPRESAGCSYTCQRLLLSVHLNDHCQYVDVPCPQTRCKERILRKDINQHQCSVTSSPPPDVQVEASTSSRGQQKVSPDATSSSAPTTTSEPSDAGVDVAAENAMLRLRLSALESVVHTLRTEMFAVKHALGPWYRADVQVQPLVEEQAGDLEASSEAFERQLAEELASQPMSIPSGTPSSPRDPADIASYFPPAEETSTSRPSRHRNASSVPHIQPPTPVGQTHAPMLPAGGSSYQTPYPNPSPSSVYAPPGFMPAPGQTSGMSFAANSPAAISIPPLDPTTPLPDTIASLHSSLVTTAGALGALAASRGAESLRTTEELRGLRAAMHGLRLQVHDILTSRTHVAGTANSGVGSNDGDGSEPPQTFNAMMNRGPGWLGYGPHPGQYGIPPVHLGHPSPFGMPHVPHPTNITKL